MAVTSLSAPFVNTDSYEFKAKLAVPNTLPGEWKEKILEVTVSLLVAISGSRLISSNFSADQLAEAGNIQNLTITEYEGKNVKNIAVRNTTRQPDGKFCEDSYITFDYDSAANPPVSENFRVNDGNGNWAETSYENLPHVSKSFLLYDFPGVLNLHENRFKPQAVPELKTVERAAISLPTDVRDIYLACEKAMAGTEVDEPTAAR